MARRGRWGQVLVATIVVYGTLPVALPAWRLLRATLGDWSNHVALVSMACVAAYALRTQRARFAKLRWQGWLAAGFAVGFWVYGLAQTSLTPAEKTHFLTYGALAWVVLRALDLETGSRGRYVAAALIVCALGWGDEVIQYFLPRRHFEWKDVGLNLVSGGAALLLIAALRGEFHPGGGATRRRVDAAGV